MNRELHKNSKPELSLNHQIKVLVFFCFPLFVEFLFNLLPLFIIRDKNRKNHSNYLKLNTEVLVLLVWNDSRVDDLI